MEMEEIDGLERKVAQLIEILPPMPANISRLMGLGSDSSRVYEQVRTMIDDDPGLCSDLLHLACDICYISGETIETIDDALKHVGVEALIQLIAVSYAEKIIRKEFAGLKYLNDYFEHSGKISLSCQILAELHGMSEHNRKMYAVAGLIHDIGRLIILLASDKTTVGLMGTSWDKMRSVTKDEKEIFGMNHSDVGMQLCLKWHFSLTMQEAVLRHHTPLIKNDFSLPGAIIFVSHFVSYSDLTGEILSTMLEPELLNYLKLTVVDFGKAHKMFQTLYQAQSKKQGDLRTGKKRGQPDTQQ